MHGVAWNVFAALTQEEPDKYKDGATEDKKSDFNWHRPAGREENKSIDNAEADCVQISASEDDFFGEREIATREWVLGAIIWMAKEFAIKN